jgi:hypothetical protein
VDIFRVKWRITGALVRTEDEREYPRARRIRLGQEDPCKYSDDECLLGFDMEQKNDLSWVKVEAIRLVVTEYQPMSKDMSVEPPVKGMESPAAV